MLEMMTGTGLAMTHRIGEPVLTDPRVDGSALPGGWDRAKFRP